ncbi:MAG: hypothetical protein KJ795_05285 [Gammaproteobacteria bacterium]|nr:hypothetical protein [Gammaproteobacteria bacterium]MBU1776561.1 hypothetical protein [Gammaproteobacteria bacterium]MBU1969440.1 hypothetical protein [Gammaproteobacteria bacterium]
MRDITTYEDKQEILALLKILALGNREIEEGKVAPVAEVARRLKTRTTPNSSIPHNQGAMKSDCFGSEKYGEPDPNNSRNNSHKA